MLGWGFKTVILRISSLKSVVVRIKIDILKRYSTAVLLAYFW
jgi:hypothetical protein